MKRTLFVLGALGSLWSAALPASAADQPTIPIAEIKRDTPVDFEKEVLPILRKNCVACHNASQAEGKLVLESPQSILKGGDSGPSAVAKKGAESILLLRASGALDDIMPPKDNKVAAKPLTSQELGLIKLWVDQGATGSVSSASDVIQWQPLPAGVNPIYAVALTQDGQYAAASRANQIFIYHVPTGRVVGRLTDPELLKQGVYKNPGVADLDLIQALAFSPSGDLLASGGYRNVKLWQRPRNVVTQKITEASEVRTLAVSPDGKLLAVGDDKGSLKLVDRATGKPVRELKGHSQAITSVRFTTDGATLYSASTDKTVRAWQVADGAVAGRFDTPGPVNALAIVNNFTQLATAGPESRVLIWSLPTATGTLPNVTGGVTLLVPSADRKLLAVVEGGDKIRLLDAATGAEQKVLAGHAGAVTTVSFQQDGKRLISAGADKTVRVWDLASGKQVATLNGSKAEVTAVALNANGSEALAGAADGSIQLWKVDPAKVPDAPEALEPDEKPLAGHTGAIRAMIYAQDNQTLYTASADGTVRGFKVAARQQAFSANHGAPVWSLAVSPDGKLLASGGENKLIKLWTVAGAPAPKPQLEGFTQPVKTVAFTGNNLRVAGGSTAGEALLFNVTTGTLEQAFGEHTGNVAAIVALGDTGLTLASAGGEKGIKLWTPSLVKEMALPKPATALEGMGATPNQLLSGSEDGNAVLWDFSAPAPRQVRAFAHKAPVTNLAVRGDLTRFVSVGTDKVARLWNVADGRQLGEMRGDLRKRQSVIQHERLVTVVKADVAFEKTQVTDAEKAVTTETEGVKKANDALAPAQKNLDEKMAALKKPTEDRDAAKKAVPPAEEAVKKAEAAKTAAVQASTTAEEAVKQATDKAKAAREAADKAKEDKALADAAAAADKALAAANEKLKEVKAAQQKAEAEATAAAAALKKAQDDLAAKEKAFTDLDKQRQDANSAKLSADRALAAAQAALKKAEARVPETKNAVTASEARQKKAEEALEAAKKAALDTEPNIFVAAFSPDGLEVATAGDDKVVRTWSAENGAPLEWFEGHTGAVRALVYADDQTLISGGADKTVVIWNTLPEWTLAKTLSPSSGQLFVDRVTALGFSPDGKTLATGGGAPSRGGELKLWKIPEGTLVRDLPDAHSDTVFGLEFSFDGKLLASSAADKFVKVFEVASGKFVKSFEGHTHHVLGVSWTSDSRTLVSCGADNVVKIWDFLTGDQKRTVQGFTKEVTIVRMIGDTINLLATSGDKTVKLIRIDNGGVVRQFTGGTDFMYSGAASLDGKTVIAGGQDSVLRVWNGDTGTVIRTFDPPAPPATNQQAQR